MTNAAFPHPVTRLELHETNISWVVLTGLYAYKIKKSIHYEFIDSSTLELRRHLCDEELRLNKRLASDLYVGVVTITRGANGMCIDGLGPIIEYAVKMKQFEASEQLSSLLERGAVRPQELSDLAVLLADFHSSLPQAPRTQGFPHTEQLHDAVLGNLATLLAHPDADTSPPELGTLIDWTHDFLHDSLPQLHMREESGFIRECHGDLHARNVVRWGGRLIPFDCLEFDPTLRWIDVMNDVAFLVMDLEAHGRKDFAFSFLNRYLERTGDYGGVPLLSFYAVYRALVRAMVDSISAEQDEGHRDEFGRRLRTRVETAAGFVRRCAPTLFIMHGPSGSGKSSLSERLAPQLGAIRIRSDLERKRLAGVPASVDNNAGFEQGIYKAEFSHRTYARLLECAENCLKGGVNAIVDATFLNTADRQLFHDLAESQSIRYIILSCESNSALLANRVENRLQSHCDPSDADAAVLEQQLRHMQPLCAEEQLHEVSVDTNQAQAYEKALVAIQSRLASVPYASTDSARLQRRS